MTARIRQRRTDSDIIDTFDVRYAVHGLAVEDEAGDQLAAIREFRAFPPDLDILRKDASKDAVSEMLLCMTVFVTNPDYETGVIGFLVMDDDFLGNINQAPR
jgi:plasmid stability protein